MHWADTELLKTLTFHSVSIDTSGWHLILSAHRRTAGIFKHALYVQAIISIYSISCHSHFAGPAFLAWPYGSSYSWLLTLEPTPGRILDSPLMLTIFYWGLCTTEKYLSIAYHSIHLQEQSRREALTWFLPLDGVELVLPCSKNWQFRCFYILASPFELSKLK